MDEKGRVWTVALAAAGEKSGLLQAGLEQQVREILPVDRKPAADLVTTTRRHGR